MSAQASTRPSGRRPDELRAVKLTRGEREAARGKQSGRTQEIQRLIGRALRSVVDMGKLGECTVQIDCDVLQADGGTRTAAITGSFVAAVSVGVYKGVPVLDLDYPEDLACDTDMNVVMTGAGRLVEVQGTAEGEPFARAELDALLGLAAGGISELIARQRQALAR